MLSISLESHFCPNVTTVVFLFDDHSLDHLRYKVCSHLAWWRAWLARTITQMRDHRVCRRHRKLCQHSTQHSSRVGVSYRYRGWQQQQRINTLGNLQKLLEETSVGWYDSVESTDSDYI